MSSSTKPRILTVGVTGHRLNQLPEQERPRIQADIAACLIAVEEAGRKAVGDVRCVLVSAIAEGADRYAADSALARSWRLVTPLPFSVERYEEDFPDETSKDHYRRLLWASHRVAPVKAEAVEKIGGDAAPYAAVGRAIIDKADVLICVWNGTPPRGPGGTSEVAALMLEKGGLVLWIAVGAENNEDVVKLVGPAPLPRAGTFRRKLHEALAETYPRTARPAEMRVA